MVKVIKFSKLFTVLAVVVGSMNGSVANAEASCSAWMDQGNGTSWAICVTDDGAQHCYLINNTAGSVAYEVSCNG